MLSGTDTPPTKATHDTYSDIKYGVGSELASGNGYALGGEDIPIDNATLASNVVQMKTTGNTAWTSATFTVYYGHTHHGATQALDGNLLMTYHSLGATAPSVSNGTMTLQWNAAGVWTITVTAEA
jgi:hypothetical protein